MASVISERFLGEDGGITKFMSTNNLFTTAREHIRTLAYLLPSLDELLLALL